MFSNCTEDTKDFLGYSLKNSLTILLVRDFFFSFIKYIFQIQDKFNKKIEILKKIRSMNLLLCSVLIFKVK